MSPQTERIAQWWQRARQILKPWNKPGLGFRYNAFVVDEADNFRARTGLDARIRDPGVHPDGADALRSLSNRTSLVMFSCVAYTRITAESTKVGKMTKIVGPAPVIRPSGSKTNAGRTEADESQP